MVNQKHTDLGIPNRFNLTSSRFSWLTHDKKPKYTLTASARDTGQRRRHGRNQLVGASNSRPAPKVTKAVDTFVEEINNRLRIETMVGAVD